MDLSKLRPVSAYPDLTDEQRQAYKVFLKEVDYSPQYNTKLEELESTNLLTIPESQLQIISEWISEYVQDIGTSFDTYESEYLKMANKHDISVRFISRYRPSGNDYQGEVYVNILEFFDIDQSPENVYALFKEFNTLITFDQYLEAVFYRLINENPGADPQEFYDKIKNIRNTILPGNMQSYKDLVENKLHWEEMVRLWRKKENDSLEAVYSYQTRLLFNSPFSGLSKNFTPVLRKLSFDIVDSGKNEILSIYDSFVTCVPTNKIPFIRVDRQSFTVSGGRDTEYAIYSYSVGYSNEWKNFDDQVDSDLFQLASFGSQGDTLSFLVDINDNGVFSSGTLTNKSFTLDVVSEANLTEISNIVSAAVLETFGIIVDNIKEVSIRLATRFATVYNDTNTTRVIDPTLFQFYLLSDRNIKMYIDESRPLVGEKRKISIKSSPDEYFIGSEEYEIRFDVSDPLNITITGPTRAKAENYFNNVFSRIVHGYVVRQSAISSALISQLTGIDASDSDFEDDGSTVGAGSAATVKLMKTRKRQLNRGMDLAKSKNDSMKRLPVLPANYARRCQCPKQPVLLTDDEVAAWKAMTISIIKEDGKTYTIKERDVRNLILPDGRSINFTCPTNALPYIGLVDRPKKGKTMKELYPCCWVERQPEIKQEEIVFPKDNECDDCDDEDTGVKSKTPMSNTTPRPAASGSKASVPANFDYTRLPASLVRFLNYGDMKEKIQEYSLYSIDNRYMSPIIASNSLLECLLLATRNREYSRESRINVTTKERVLMKYRQRLSREVDAMAYTQEIYDILLRGIDNQIQDYNRPLTYKLHSHGLEEFFKIHLYSFVVFPKKASVDADDFQLEIPNYQVAHLKTLYSERPSVIVISFPNEPNKYSLVSTTSDQKSFPGLTRYLHNVFTMIYETASSNPSKYMVSNIYSRTNWENFFGSSSVNESGSTRRITGQEIDSYGKTRVLQIDGRLTISIPPTQPLNVPRVTEYFKSPEALVLEMFGEPNSYDEDGFWYPWMDFNDAIYVLVEHERSLSEVEPGSTSSINTKTSIFKGTFLISDQLNDRIKYQKSCNALVQLIHWGWKLDRRVDIERWWSSHIKRNNSRDRDSSLPKLIKISLPDNVNTAKEAFKWASRWWPEVFDSRTGTVNVYSELYDKLTQFFRREAEVMGGYNQDPVPPILFKIYENPGDYPQVSNRIIFTSSSSFNDWITEKKSPSTKFYYNIPPDMKVFSNISPIRLFHWGRIVVIQNVASGTYDDALYVAAYWSKYYVNLGHEASITKLDPEALDIDLDSQTMAITVYAVSKIFTLIPFNDVTPKRVVDLKAYVVMSPNGRYSALLI